ncbi:Hypothetical predicted protein [Marmota monax]|uniref:G-protein coupled receptors family 1 profile domain-containing protein n=1 Tax=Marmota monax TaxID=9995 RepID=A0A5E4CJ42_MARMO|nr:Hypothetical predicted protein [Marmota monax]
MYPPDPTISKDAPSASEENTEELDNYFTRANFVLLMTIWQEASLHEPMYYLLAIFSVLDVTRCLTVIPKQFVINAAIFIVFRNLLATLPIPVLAARLNYCASNVVENCICANISVAKLSCGDIHLNKLYQFVSVWCLLGSDLVLILLSYCFILRALISLQSGGATTKALSTCGSHLSLILFFYTLLLFFIFTNKAGKKIPSKVPILLNVLHHLIPPAFNPIVYGVHTQEIKQGIIKLFKSWS